MPEFTHEFTEHHPKNAKDAQLETEHAHRTGTIDRFDGLESLDEIATRAKAAIAEMEEFSVLPERNKKLILDMSGIMLAEANAMGHHWRQNYWGLYIVGSRARHDYRSDSDLDLLSVGTFYGSLGFSAYYTHQETPVFEGYNTEVLTQGELPSEYNVGEVDRKYLIRAAPEEPEDGTLSVDLSVVDLTFLTASLADFKTTMDIDHLGNPLPRIPIVEVTVPDGRSY